MSTGEPAVEAERQIHVFSVKQQLYGCTATIMNPIEGEQGPGGQPFRGGQKAISCVLPLFACAHVGISQRMELCMVLRIAFRGAGVCCCRWTGIIASADIYWKIPPEFVVVRIKSQCQA